MAPITINCEIGVIEPNEDQDDSEEDDTDDQISFETVEELSENGQIDDWVLGHSPSGVFQEADHDVALTSFLQNSEVEPMEVDDQAPVSPGHIPAPPAVNPVELIQSLSGEEPLIFGRWRDGRSSRAPQYSARYNEYKKSLADKANMVLLDEFRTNELALVAEPFEPQGYDQAVASHCPEKWMAAFKEEFDSLEKNNTWKLVEKLPPGYTAINCKWIGKIKPGYEGVPERYKGRLVAIGCRQNFGRDYDEVFSPVAHQEAVKATLSEVASRGLYAKQIDIKTAFLYSERDKKMQISVSTCSEIKTSV